MVSKLACGFRRGSTSKTYEKQGQILVQRPGDQDKKRNHASRDLNAGTNAYADCQLHLPFTRHPHRGHMFRSVSDQGQQDEANEPDISPTAVNTYLLGIFHS